MRPSPYASPPEARLAPAPSPADDSEPAAAALVAAVRACGGSFDGLSLRLSPRLGLCAFASRDLPAGHAAIVLPPSAALTPETAAAWLALHGGVGITSGPLGRHSAAEAASAEAPSPRAQLLAYLAACRMGAPGCAALHVAYAQSLPASFCAVPLLWPPGEAGLLDGTDAGRTLALQRRELGRQRRLLLRAWPGALRSLLSPPAAFLWAHAAHASRCFPASMLPADRGGAAGESAATHSSAAAAEEVAASDAAAPGVLLPLLDVLNHGCGGAGGGSPGVRWDAGRGVASLSRPLKRGAQLLSFYGAKPTGQWLLAHGLAPLLPPNGPHEAVALRVAAVFPDVGRGSEGGGDRARLRLRHRERRWRAAADARKRALFARLARRLGCEGGGGGGDAASVLLALTGSKPLPPALLPLCRLVTLPRGAAWRASVAGLLRGCGAHTRPSARAAGADRSLRARRERAAAGAARALLRRAAGRLLLPSWSVADDENGAAAAAAVALAARCAAAARRGALAALAAAADDGLPLDAGWGGGGAEGGVGSGAAPSFGGAPTAAGVWAAAPADAADALRLAGLRLYAAAAAALPSGAGGR